MLLSFSSTIVEPLHRYIQHGRNIGGIWKISNLSITGRAKFNTPPTCICIYLYADTLLYTVHMMGLPTVVRHGPVSQAPAKCAVRRLSKA